MLGGGLVPETVTRPDGPFDAGSLQRLVDADFEQHYFTLLEVDTHHPVLKRMATFDVIANNADRKGGHCLLDADEPWGIDTACASTPTQSCVRSCGTPPADRWPIRTARSGRAAARGLPDQLTALLHPDERRALEDPDIQATATNRSPAGAAYDPPFCTSLCLFAQVHERKHLSPSLSLVCR